MEDLDFTISPHLSDLLDEEDEELDQSRREQNEKEWMAIMPDSRKIHFNVL